MASCLRRPVTSMTGLHSLRQLQCRPFSKVSSQWAVARGQLGPQARQQTERSVKVASKEMGKMSNDLGLLPHTFIFPRGANRPSLLRNPRGVAKLTYTWLKRRLQGYLAVLVYKYANAKPLKLQPRQLAPTALGLHRQMYSAFVSADLALLDTLCCDGLRASFRARIAARPRGERWQWELVRYRGRARVVSHRGASLGIEGLGIRQAVVRIASVQKLTRFKPGGGGVVEGSGRERQTVEYLVIQKKLERGVEGEWMVWGTTEETTLSKLRAEETEDLPDEGSEQYIKKS